jgi:ribosomal protein L34
MPKGRKKKIRHTTIKRRRYGFRARSKTAGGRNVIRRRRRKRGKFAR